MTNWLRLFLSPVGHIGQRSFWHGWLVLTALNVALISLGSGLWGHDGAKPAALVLITLYPTICLYSKRLHDLRKSGWLQAPSRIIWAICLASVLFPQAEDNSALIPLTVLYGLSILSLAWDAVLLFLCAARPGASAEEGPVAAFD